MPRLGDLTSPGFAALDKGSLVVLVPVGIVEEHGPHLPLDTDTIQAEWTCAAVAERTGAYTLAPVAHGNCSSTRPFPGSISLSFDTVRAILRDLYAELRRNGVQRVVVVSGHAGGAHMRAIRLAGEEAVGADPRLKLLVLSDYELLDDFDAKAAAGVDLPRWDGHAGAVETSRMLAIAPKLVRGRAAAHRVSFPDFRIEADPSRHFPEGVMGDPTLASEALGRAANEHIVARLCDLVRDLAKE